MRRAGLVFLLLPLAAWLAACAAVLGIGDVPAQDADALTGTEGGSGGGDGSTSDGAPSPPGDASAHPDSAQPTDGGSPADGSSPPDGRAPVDTGLDAPAPPADARADGQPAGCGLDQKLCDGGCVAQSDPSFGCAAATCGACSLPNTVSALCTDAGACGVAICETGYSNCTSSPGAGCQTNTGGDPSHCGTCTTACTSDSGAAYCNSGECSSTACDAGTANCTGGLACSTNTESDTQNCGGCGHVCGNAHGTPSCAGGACSFVCTAPYAHCSSTPDDQGCAVDTNTDDGNCGKCGSPCLSGTLCSGGSCACNTASACAGCCNAAGTVCETESFSASCGTGGVSCHSCDAVENDECVGTTACGCSTNTGGASCASGQHCTAAGCSCDSTSCPTGCCNAGACDTSPGYPTCAGAAGAACTTCSPSTSNSCGTSGCSCGGGANPVCGGADLCCRNACTNTQGDPSNCGGCGNVCTGTTCSAGHCQPIVIATLNDPLLATFEHVAIDAANIYFSTGDGAQIGVCPLAGCPGGGTNGMSLPTYIFSGTRGSAGTGAAFGYLHYDVAAGNLYFADENGGIIYSITTAGTLNWTIPGVGNEVGGITSDGTNLYWGTGTGIQSAPLASGSPVSTWAAAATQSWDVWYDPTSTNVFGAIRGGATNLVMYPPEIVYGTTGGAPTTLMTAGIIDDPFTVFVSGSTLLVGAGTNGPTSTVGVFRAPVSNPTSFTPLATGTTYSDVLALVADGTNAYFFAGGSGALYKCAIAGCGGAPEAIVPSSGQVEELAVDAQYLYWGATDYVYKIPK